MFYQALAAKKPDFPAGLALARESPLPKAEIKVFHFMFKYRIEQKAVTGEKGRMAKHPKALQAVWDRWNFFLWQSPLLGQLWVEVSCCFCCYLVTAAVGLCSGNPEGMQRQSAALRLGSRIRKEESNDSSRRQLQGHHLSQKQFKNRREQFGC